MRATDPHPARPAPAPARAPRPSARARHPALRAPRLTARLPRAAARASDLALASLAVALFALPAASLLAYWRAAGQPWVPAACAAAALAIALLRLRLPASPRPAPLPPERAPLPPEPAPFREPPFTNSHSPAPAPAPSTLPPEPAPFREPPFTNPPTPTPTPTPTPAAPTLLLASALLLRALASLTAEPAFSFAGLPLAALGAAALLLPRPDALARLWPAALALAAAVPPPAPVSFGLLLALKTAAARAATSLLSACGTPAMLDGYVIRLGAGAEVRVLDACSGVRLQAALLAIALVFVLARAGSREFRRAALLAAVPAAFAASVLRIAVVCVVRAGWPGWAIEPLHDVTGALVVAPAVLLMVAAGRAAEALAEARRAP